MKKVASFILGLILSNAAIAETNVDSIVYDLEYFLTNSKKEPFHVEHLTRVSICQDETLANCHEFVTDKYHTVAGLEGYIHNDMTTATVDLAPLKMAYQSYEPSEELDEMVKNSVYLNDRYLAHVG